jgi:glycosyltransferase involved in cell wall biosynthesis
LPRLVVQWPRLGPYHLARLRATHERFVREGWGVTALETAGTDRTYAWREETAPEPFVREQIFPGSTYDALAPSAIHRGVTMALDRIDPDAVAINSYAGTDAQAALVWCRRRRRTAVCFMESTAADAARAPGREWAKGRIVKAFDSALAGGSPQRAYVVRLGVPDARVFEPYDVVDNAFFESGAARARADMARTLPGLGDDRPFFLASNRFVARKNLARLIEAFAAFREGGGPPWRLVLLGDGPEREALDRLVAERRVPDVTFAGFQQIEALPDYYAHAGAFVHPALVEPWGLVINEALACGLPVVASDRVGAAADLVRDGVTGFQFDPELTDVLTGLLGRLAGMSDDERRKMGENGRAVVAGWSPEQFAKGLWSAVLAGREVADRGLPLVAGALLWAQRTAARRPDSFHTLRE